MPTWGAFWPWIQYHWQGPPSLQRPTRLEWRLVAIRWLGIVFVSIGLLLMPLSDERRIAAFGVLGFAAAYNLVVRTMILRAVPLTRIGMVTTFSDSVLSLGFLYLIDAGFSSPFAMLLFSVTLSVAMRYGYKLAILQCTALVVTDAIEAILRTHQIDSLFVFFSGYLFIVAVLASYLREEASRAEEALHQRLRQANLLNEATGMLAVSLQFEPLLAAVTRAATRLFDSECAVLKPAGSLFEVEYTLPATVSYPPVPHARYRELELLCAQTASTGLPPDLPLWQPLTLLSGVDAIVMQLALPERQITFATLALALPSSRSTTALDPDVVESFAKRVALAIENASL